MTPRAPAPTPLPHELAADLIMRLPEAMDFHDHLIRDLVPDPDGGLTGIRQALRAAHAGTGEAGVDGSDPAHRVRADPDWSR